jgi:hypothetical protein
MACVLAVDDAAFMGKVVSDALASGGHEVVGEVPMAWRGSTRSSPERVAGRSARAGTPQGLSLCPL